LEIKHLENTMNDFTKKELKEISDSLRRDPFSAKSVAIKIQAMIDNYCQLEEVQEEKLHELLNRTETLLTKVCCDTKWTYATKEQLIILLLEMMISINRNKLLDIAPSYLDLRNKIESMIDKYKQTPLCNHMNICTEAYPRSNPPNECKD